MNDIKYLTKIVYSCLLGDASITSDKRDNGNSTFETSQIVDHLDYLEHLKNILEQITSFKLSMSREEKESAWIVDRFCHSKELWRLRSSRHPFFNNFRQRVYIDGKKVVDPHYLKLLDWEMIAVWYMDDGHISDSTTTNNQGKKYPANTIGISTQGFSYGDHMLLKRAAKEILDIDFNIRQQRNQLGNLKYRLFLANKDTAKFVHNISKYILPSFEYKLKLTQASHINNLEEIIRTENSEKSDDDIV